MHLKSISILSKFCIMIMSQKTKILAFYIYFVASTSFALPSQVSSITKFKGFNFSKWSKQILFGNSYRLACHLLILISLNIYFSVRFGKDRTDLA